VQGYQGVGKDGVRWPGVSGHTWYYHLPIYLPALQLNLTNGSYCETGVLELPGGRKIGGQATQAVYEITVLEEYAKVNNMTGTIIVASGLNAKVTDLSLTNSVEVP
jgi:hypothetical protein